MTSPVRAAASFAAIVALCLRGADAGASGELEETPPLRGLAPLLRPSNQILGDGGLQLAFWVST